MSLTPDEMDRWLDFVRRHGDLGHPPQPAGDRTARPNAWPRRFHLWRFWR